MRALRPRFAVLALVAVLAPACGGGGAASKRSNVLFVVIDALRADRTDFEGSRRHLTPFLGRLAAEGTTFARAYANTSWTMPSVASLFTSRYQDQHGVVRFSSLLSDEELTLAEVLAGHGFASAGLSANFLLRTRNGFGQGFDHWQHLVGDLEGYEPSASASEVREAALRWLDQHEGPSGSPVFLYLHFMEPHSLYSPPEPFRSQRLPPGTTEERVRLAQEKMKTLELDALSPQEVAVLEALYDAEVAALDRELETLFAELAARGFLEGAVVVVTADHGEEFREHGGLGHGRGLFEEVVRIPLLVIAPQLRGGRTVQEPVSLVDVAPTVLELLGLPAEPGFEGRSLVGLMEGRVHDDVPVLLELAASGDTAPGLGDRRKHASGIVHGDLKLLLGPEGQGALFELQRDPGERAPLDPAGSPPGVALRDELARTRSRLEERMEAVGPGLDEERLRQLRALGYVPERTGPPLRAGAGSGSPPDR